nr:immunoglobulin light chain junction region [Macaca mulatta]MOX16922.1 immunoglobulin light chain junction region [Macaca mulatta]MOX17868.1 immunoglobulin light chain junction region [Macaca mulatta]MOX18514.1 immunoglobulin light chain junction region [Macaca mulatta]
DYHCGADHATGNSFVFIF